MSVNIINSLSIQYPESISYGMDIELQFTGTIGFRNKIGVDIEVNSEFIGAVEVDFSQAGVSYFVTIDLIKQYIEKGAVETTEVGLVSDSMQLVKLTPYTKSRPDGGVWTAKVYGNSKSFYAVRGINSRYYLNGDKTPYYPNGSRLFDNDGGTYTLNIPDTHWGYLYYGVSDTSNPSSRGINGTIQYWGTFNPNPESSPALITTVPFDIRGGSQDDMKTAFLSITKPVYPSYTISYIKYIFDEMNYEQTGDTIVKSWDIKINYVCSNDWDFKLSLVYLDSTFNWSSIPFYIKNQNSITREVNTVEGYDYAKKDYNLKARRVFDLKSDYMTKVEIDSILLFGLTPEIKIKTAAVDEMQDARLLSSSVPIVSGKNETMYQLEIQVEISELILTP